jgi:D-threo-aldose 1-dehydrogenase
MSHPGIRSIALNTSKPQRIKQNISLTSASIPVSFWRMMKAERLISDSFKYI